MNMDDWKKALLVAGGGAVVASMFLPIWRSGSNSEVSFVEFFRNHTIFGDGDHKEMYE